MKDSPYFATVQLMLRCIPEVAKEKCFALKGGTAINLFVRDVPRLSVDIDLAYLPTDPFDQAMKNVNDALLRIKASIEKNIPGSKVQTTLAEKNVYKLVVNLNKNTVKIEPNPVVRGSVFPTKKLTLVKNAVDLFQMQPQIDSLSFHDLYGGKLCAAMDRQHPRDLFDMHILLKNEGITKEIRQAFVIYLASNKRPMNEILDPTRKEIKADFEEEFEGMTEESFDFKDLIKTREDYISIVKKDLTENERKFFLSIKELNPKWDLLPIPGLDKLPAIQWKLENLKRIPATKHEAAVKSLKAKLNL